MRLRCLAEEVDRAVHHLDALGGLFSGNEDESAHRRQTPGVAAPLLHTHARHRDHIDVGLHLRHWLPFLEEPSINVNNTRSQ